MEKSINYSLLVQDTFSLIQNTILSDKKDLSTIIHHIQQVSSYQRELKKELARYEAMRPDEIKPYTKILISELTQSQSWLNDYKLNQIFNKIHGSSFKRIHWYKIVSPNSKAVSSIPELNIEQITIAFYHHINEIKSWLEAATKDRAKGKKNYRIRAIAYKFRVAAGLATHINGAEYGQLIEKELGEKLTPGQKKRAEQDYNSINKTKIIPPDEIEKAIPYLDLYPDAKNLAIKALGNL